jgi:hypothetical protein
MLVGCNFTSLEFPFVVQWHAPRALASFPPEVLELAISVIWIAIFEATGRSWITRIVRLTINALSLQRKGGSARVPERGMWREESGQ